MSRAADEAEIVTLAVRPAFRRKGIAAMMLARFAEELGGRGTARIVLDVSESNLPARALDESAGFTITGRRRNYYGPGQDAILMARAC